MTVLRSGDGGSITYTNAGSAIASGDVVVMGSTLGVALDDIAASGGIGEVAIEGEFRLPKVSAAVIAVGDSVFWDVSTDDFDDNAAIAAVGDIVEGAIAMEPGAALATTLLVKLTPPGQVT